MDQSYIEKIVVTGNWGGDWEDWWTSTKARSWRSSYGIQEGQNTLVWKTFILGPLWIFCNTTFICTICTNFPFQICTSVSLFRSRWKDVLTFSTFNEMRKFILEKEAKNITFTFVTGVCRWYRPWWYSDFHCQQSFNHQGENFISIYPISPWLQNYIDSLEHISRFPFSWPHWLMARQLE